MNGCVLLNIGQQTQTVTKLAVASWDVMEDSMRKATAAFLLFLKIPWLLFDLSSLDRILDCVI